MTLLPVVIEGGQIRPMVPFAMTWPCPACGIDERAEGIALADTGAGFSILPERALPPHVRFDDLPAGPTVRLTRVELEARLWSSTITVLGVPIAMEWKVYRGSRPDYAILGTESLFRFFRCTFDLGADPPFWDLTPIPRAMAPVPIETLPLIAYGETTYRHVGPGSAFAPTPGPALTSPAEALRMPMLADPAPALLPHRATASRVVHRRLGSGDPIDRAIRELAGADKAG